MTRTKRILLVGFCVSAGLPVATPSAQAQQPDYESIEVADGVYRFRWIGHNGLWIVTPAGVVAVDPISVEAARTMGSEIQRLAPGQPLAAIIYSHHHDDHATGALALVETMDAPAVPILAHEATLAAVEALHDPDLPPPTVTYSERMRFDLGGRTIELHYLGPSHSDNVTVVRVPDAGVVFAVDFVARDRLGYQDLSGHVFPEFFTALSRMLELDFETVVYGHGPEGDRGSVQRQIQYYDDLRSGVANAVERGLTEDQAARSVRLPAYADWGQYDAWIAMNVRGVYRWLAEEARR